MARKFTARTGIHNSRGRILSWYRLPATLVLSLLLLVFSSNDALAQGYSQSLFPEFLKNPYLTIGFLVPGMIILFVRSRFMTGKLDSSNTLLAYFAVSCVYYALVLPVVSFPWIHKLDYQDPLGWILFLFLGPAVFGVLLGVDIQGNYTRKLLKKIGLNTVHSVSSAWDWKFNRQRQPQWVVLTLKNGDVVGGFFGKKSYASSETTRRDLYLEQSYRIDYKNRLYFEGKEGSLVFGEEIRTIEFLPAKHREI